MHGGLVVLHFVTKTQRTDLAVFKARGCCKLTSHQKTSSNQMAEPFMYSAP